MNEQQTRWYLRSGTWFWCVIALGGAIRFYLVVVTEGTRDVEIWKQHARDVLDYGLIAYYHGDPSANHPPFITEVEARFLRVSHATGTPFRILLRAPFAVLDVGTTFLLLGLLGHCRWRFLAAAAYWLNPLSIIFSAYHGNTDSAVAFFLVLCVWLLSNEKLIAAAMAIGVSLWIKLPIVIAIPALVLFIPDWRKRFQFLVVAGVVAAVTYLPAMVQDPAIVWENVFRYRGLYVHTTGGDAVWGPVRVVLLSMIAPPARWPEISHAPIMFFVNHGTIIVLALVLLLSFLRSSARSIMDLCATIAMIYTVVYGLGDRVTFQYFAWSIPFWFFVRPWFTVGANLLAGAYVYSLYWLLTGNPWLLGPWDFYRYTKWPSIIIFFRDSACLFFLLSAFWFLISEIISAIRNARLTKSGDSQTAGDFLHF